MGSKKGTHHGRVLLGDMLGNHFVSFPLIDAIASNARS